MYINISTYTYTCKYAERSLRLNKVISQDTATRCNTLQHTATTHAHTGARRNLSLHKVLSRERVCVVAVCVQCVVVWCSVLMCRLAPSQVVVAEQHVSLSLTHTHKLLSQDYMPLDMTTYTHTTTHTLLTRDHTLLSRDNLTTTLSA